MKSWQVGPDHIFPGTPTLFAPPARKKCGLASEAYRQS